jgi:rod shape-determining protein MreC
MSILNNNARISAKLKTSNQVGSFYWDGNDYRIGLLVDIPSHVQINIGDTVVTSGYSFIFPENQPIGTVEDYSIETGDSFYKIKVRFSVDYNSLYYVYIIGNRLHDELRELEQTDLNK